MRIGMGYDVHKFAEGRDLILGGVKIPYESGLLGHSDADVLTHAIMDALLGAAALGDIGKLFPDTDDKYKGADSIELLKEVGRRLEEKAFLIENIDATIIAQAPKMRPYIDEMRKRIADALLIGLCQCVATIPGVSRSGVTITAGMARGLDREFAVKFSFLLSIPAVAASALLTLIDAVRAGIDGSLIPAYLIGTAVSALVGVASIRLLQRITRRGNFGRFCYYLWGAGIITIILTVLF